VARGPSAHPGVIEMSSARSKLGAARRSQYLRAMDSDVLSRTLVNDV